MKDYISLKDANRLYVYSVLQEVFEYLREQEVSSVLIANQFAKHAVSVLKDYGVSDDGIEKILTVYIKESVSGDS